MTRRLLHRGPTGPACSIAAFRALERLRCQRSSSPYAFLKQAQRFRPKRPPRRNCSFGRSHSLASRTQQRSEMKHGKRLGGALATNGWLHDRGLNVGSLSGATDAMFVPRSPNPASFATYRRSAARPSIKGWKPIGTSTSVTLPSRGSTSASLDRTEQTTNYRERASATKRGSDGRAGRTAREYEVQCTGV